MARRAAQRGGSRRRGVSNVLLVAGILLLAVAGGIWLSRQAEYHEQADEAHRLAAYVDDAGGQPADDGSGEGQVPEVDWAGLKALNPEVVAWLQIPGTIVNYPVYQADDNEYYLHHDAEGRTSVAGQVFLDCDNAAPGLVDAQSVLYGHHLRNGAMFQPISRLDDQDVFDATPTVWYLTEGASYELEPLLVYYTTPDDMAVRTFSFASDEALRGYLADRLQRAEAKRADAAEIIAGTSHVLTLSTCNYYDGYGRTELVCVPKVEARAATDGVSS